MKITKEDNPEYAPYRYALNAYCLDNPQCFKPTNLSSLLPLASRADWFLLVIGAVIVWLISYGKQKEDVRMYVAKKALPVRWILYLVLLFAVLICGVYGPGYDASSFIYGQF